MADNKAAVARSRLAVGSTWRLVTLCALLTLVPLGVLAFFSVHLATDAVRDTAKTQVRQNAAMSVNTFQTALTSATDTLGSFASRPVLRTASADPQHSRVLLRDQLLELQKTESPSEAVFLAGADGKVELALPQNSRLEGVDVSQSEWYRGVLASGKPYVSGAFRSAAPGHPNVIAIAAPIHSPVSTGAEGISGILVSTFKVASTQGLVDYFSKSLGIEITLTDQHGMLLASPGQKQTKLVSVADDPLVGAALKGRSGVQTQPSQQGDLLSAFAPIPASGWTVTASVPTRTAFAGVNKLRSTVLVVAGLLALALIAGLALFARALRQRSRAELVAQQNRTDAEHARAEAEEANRAKSEFLSRMSHELRTPLNSVLGFGQLLSMRELDARGQESVAQILKGGQHLLTLINEVLDIARVEAGKLQLSLEPVDLHETINEALDLVHPLAREAEITITVEHHDGDSHVTADRQRLSQVMLNLLSNAIKYNEHGGSVRVTTQPTEHGMARISVTDTGAGISADGLARLFTPFERLNADEKQIEGTGLGLTLSKALVEAMGGTIRAESDAGNGTTFHVDLLATASQLARVNDDHISTLAPLTSKRPYTILYVEDNLSNLKLVQHILGDTPEIHLIAAMQGSLGLDLAREHRPDLVLLDLHLPDMQGDEVLARLRDDPDLRETPVVILSADATKGRIERLLEQGAEAYLSKPIDVKEFLDVIHRHTQRLAA